MWFVQTATYKKVPKMTAEKNLSDTHLFKRKGAVYSKSERMQISQSILYGKGKIGDRGGRRVYRVIIDRIKQRRPGSKLTGCPSTSLITINDIYTYFYMGVENTAMCPSCCFLLASLVRVLAISN
jgi:hypothetical protein